MTFLNGIGSHRFALRRDNLHTSDRAQAQDTADRGSEWRLADGCKGRIFAGMDDILGTASSEHEEPKLIVRKAPHGPVWSVYAVLEGIPSEEIFEGSTEEEASNWINTGGQTWLEERRKKRS